MEILLLNPPMYVKELHTENLTKRNRLWEFLIGENGILSGKQPITGRQPPLGLLYLSAILKKHNHKVHFLDGFFNTKDEILDYIKKHNIKNVGISSVSYNWRRAKELIDGIKSQNPDIFVITGGPHPNVWREKCFEESSNLDALSIGDSEFTLLEILDRREMGKSLKGVKGTIVRENGKVIINPPREPIQDLDSLPFLDRDIIEIEKYQPSPLFYKKLPWTAIIGSRGCPYRCTFCHSDKRLRLRSPKNIVDEMEFLMRRYGIKDVTFYDETFTIPKKRVLEICDEIKKRKLDMVWSVNARVNTVDKEILTKMKQAGCWRVLYGLESGVQSVLNRMKKDITPQQMKDAIRLTRDVGLESYGIFIFGMPNETYEMGLETIKFAKTLDLDYCAFSTLDPLPGTEVYEEVKDEAGYKGVDYLYSGAISYTSKLTTEENLKKLVRRGYRKFYLRPSYALRRLSRIRSGEDFKRNLRGFFLVASS
ncbi:MAG: radical SAM protein [Candidatus Woesearchaeota archaeon]